MKRRDHVTIAADPWQVWDVWRDVEAWPTYVDMIERVELRAPELALGAQVRIHQPRVPTDLWTVTWLEEGRGWTWQTRGPGVVTTATHLVSTGVDGTLAEASMHQKGVVGVAVGWMFGPLVARYLRLELAGLRHQVEGG